MNNSANDEIFYSDDEFSDGESTVQVKLNPNNIDHCGNVPKIKMNSTQEQMRSALSYHPSASFSSPVTYPSSSSDRSSAPIIETPYKPPTPGSYASSMKIGSTQKNYLQQEKEVPVTSSNLSYSAAAKKAGDAPQVSVLTNLDAKFWQFFYSAVFVHPRSQVCDQR